LSFLDPISIAVDCDSHLMSTVLTAATTCVHQSQPLTVSLPRLSVMSLSFTPSPSPSSAIWRNNGGKRSMTRIQNCRNPRMKRQLQLSPPFHLVPHCRVLLPEGNYPASVPVGCHCCISLKPFQRSKRFSSIPLRGPTLCFKQIFCILFCVDVVWTVDQRQLVGQLLRLDFAMPVVSDAVRLRGSTSLYWASWWLSQLLESVAGCA